MARRNIDIQTLRQQIQELDIDNELKSRLLDAVSKQKKYGLVWENHKEDAEEVMREKLPVLIEDNGKRLDKGGKDAPNHILIEGDNLHALTALTYTHEGMVDVIYIDPPYNTGNKDFVYNDSFVDSEDGYRHSKWLSFMEKRLHIAKKLLSDRGVIFISIDDNEQANLKLLCDEVFGEVNFVSEICIKMSHLSGMKMSHKDKKVPKIKEFALIYCKSRELLTLNTIYVPGEWDSVLDRYTSFIENHSKPIEEWYKIPLREKTKGMTKEEKLDFQLKNASHIFRTAVNDSISDTPKDSKFRLVVTKQGLEKCIYNAEEVLLASTKMKRFGNKLLPAETIGDIWNDIGINNLHNEGGVQYPNGKKPLKLIERFIKMVSQKDSIILDFFAGSGTTLHATMLLNDEDNGNRQCILTQCVERSKDREINICTDITYKRIENVINGYVTTNNIPVAGLSTNNLRYYKVDFVERDNGHEALRKQAYAMTDILCIKEGIYSEETSFGCLPLSGKEKMIRYFADDKKQMLLIYDSRVIPFAVREIAKMADDTNIKVYVFADGSYPYTADFDDVLSKVTLIAMPYAMNSTLKNVLPEKQDEIMEGEPENIDDND